MSREFDFEEDFHAKDRKGHRKDRKAAQLADRSKFKKTDANKKEAPTFDPSLKRARVVSITGEGIWIDVDGERRLSGLKGLLKKEKKQAKNIISVGDYVRLVDGSIAHIEERYSFLARSDITGRKEQLIAVNVDQVIIAVSITDPPLKPALVDRYLIAAEKGNLHPIIVLNKIDLLEEGDELYKEFLIAYEALGYPILSVSTITGVGLEALRSLLKDKTSVFSGQSGVGKSSLLNACYGLTLRTGEMAQKTSKGSHTTTASELLSLPEGGYCVDTPGIRSFGIWDLQKEEVIQHFHDLSSDNCKFPDCIHLNEPGCAVLEKLEEGKISRLRYESYQTLLIEAMSHGEKKTYD